MAGNGPRVVKIDLKVNDFVLIDLLKMVKTKPTKHKEDKTFKVIFY